MLTLHKPAEIFSRRHVPSWLMLAFAAGCVNATALVACQRFVTHVTGTVTQLGMEVARLALLLDFALVVCAFIGGAMLSSFLINGRAHRGKQPFHALPLIIVALITLTCGIGGRLGWFGLFGGEPDEPVDFMLLGLLSFASGLQNASVATSTGLLVRTTHLTGPATDLGIHLVELFYTEGEQRRATLQHALLRGGKIIAFGVGAAAGVALAHRLHFTAFVVPALIIGAAVLRSFLPGRIAGEEPIGETEDVIDKAALDVPSRGRPSTV